jgi:hypothetical protein
VEPVGRGVLSLEKPAREVLACCQYSLMGGSGDSSEVQDAERKVGSKDGTLAGHRKS